MAGDGGASPPAAHTICTICCMVLVTLPVICVFRGVMVNGGGAGARS
jgi:hypothetical protein